MTATRERHSGEGRLGNVSGALLLGGPYAGTRSDESQRTPFGVSMATRTARLLDQLYLEVLLVGGTPPEGAPGRVVPELPGTTDPPCALRDLVSALAESRAERVQVVAVEFPLVTPDLLVALMAWPEFQAVVPRDERGVHPLCAIYRRESVLRVARRRLEGGDYGLESLLAELDTAYFEGEDLAAVDPDGTALLSARGTAAIERRLLEAFERGDYRELTAEFWAELRSRAEGEQKKRGRC